MPFDPLYVTTEGLSALLRELGVPEGVAVTIWRPGPVWRAAHDARLDAYQIMALFSGTPDAEGQWPPTWVEGSAPYIWLVRIRHGQDLAHGELRPSSAEGVLGRVQWPLWVDGQAVEMQAPERDRAWFGVKLLLGALPLAERAPDAVVYPQDVARFRDRILGAMVDLFNQPMSFQEITQPVVARVINMGLRTMQRRLSEYGLSWEALKHEAFPRSHVFHA